MQIKKFSTLLLLLIFTTLAAFTQDIAGKWKGTIAVQGIQLRIIFNIIKTDKGYNATMDSPDQNVKNIPIKNTSFENAQLKLEIADLAITYNGILKDSIIIGTFQQSQQSVPMDLIRMPFEKATASQEPPKPYPYHSEDIFFQNQQAHITLAGTLTLPNKSGSFPVVILITGSGPQDRDEALLGHKPFLIISDHLTKNGIAVLRFDDRGIGQSTGVFQTATSADFASDVESAIAYLKTRKEIDQKKIGLIGHSEGGMIAPMIAASSKDVHFIVLLAGPGMPCHKLLLLQQELIAKADGAPTSDIQETKEVNTAVFNMILHTADTSVLKKEVANYLRQKINAYPESQKPKGMTDEQLVDIQLQQTLNPWIQYFIKYDPTPTLEKITCPVLALNGEKDLQVPFRENLHGISEALQKGGNKDATIKAFPGLNHLFQECTTGSPNEYALISQTFSPIALDFMTQWIKDKTK